ncbi:PREDICTED: bestrophin-4 isoform X2 [Thamnophis sirtalis]|uniref:Bestrophin homolog n=1 Tax=Thamnophis sirtalis TaxID=35019 RepID=A0A6I9XN56_9SAUR|nr:PREDICTED: bestrophin-4 isoform X2 [Thamnophis sirtalis]
MLLATKFTFGAMEKTCNCSTNITFQKFRTKLAPETCCLNFTWTKIDILDWSIFAGTVGLKELHLSNCDISHIKNFVSSREVDGAAMTVSYTLKVANARFGGFSKLLFRWKGSIYKLLYKEFLGFIVLYAGLSAIYRYLLNEYQKRLFEKVAKYCKSSTDLIPLSFVLGFYVTLIVNRWWAQYTSIPLPDQLMCVISSNVHGKDDKGRILRRTLIRYANLSSVLILRSVSTRVLKRFPTMDHIVEAGFMTQDERKKYESLHSDFNKYWIPCVWFTNLAAQARREGRVRDDVALRLLMDVVTIAVYSFFAFCVVGRQFLDGDLDIYVPLPTLLQFFFYAGWLKVAEQIINPFGEDDDDFETNKLIDRNLQVSLLSVDDMYQNLPPTGKDKYWNESTAQPPYTTATLAETLKPSFMGSTFDMRMSDDPEQNQQVDASPSMNRIQTPLLSRFYAAAASPAISLKNFGKGNRISHPQLLRLRSEGIFPSASPNFNRREDPEAVGRIDEEETEDEETGISETGMPHNAERKDIPIITVIGSLDDSISSIEQPSSS